MLAFPIVFARSSSMPEATRRQLRTFQMICFQTNDVRAAIPRRRFGAAMSGEIRRS